MNAPLSLARIDVAPCDADTAFLHDVLRGLAAARKVVPARWLYDERGAALFEAITRVPEYYPTRTERALLETHVAAMAQRIGPHHAVIEFGAGSASKTPLLLAAIKPAAYVPIDISGEFLQASARQLAARFPGLPVHTVIGDFTRPLQLPALGKAPRLGFFPGSTIGNLVAPAAVDLLRSMAATLGPGSRLLMGFDRLKPATTLLPAYDDAQGVTAAFNLNLLHRINRELAGDIPIQSFRHKAIWNATESRIEMHLEAVCALAFSVAGQRFRMHAGETIHTENSIKYEPRDMRLLLHAGGWSLLDEWNDAAQLFSVVLAEAIDPGVLQP
jgi:dimethylhistidine N-methyltransferase